MKGECGTYGGEYRLLGCSAEKSKKKKRPFRISWRKWEDNIKNGLDEIGKKGVDSTKVAQDREE